MQRALIILLLAIGLLGCGTASQADSTPKSSGPPREPGVHLSVNGTGALILRPTVPTDRLVLFVHGSDSLAEVLEEEGEEVKPLVEVLLAHGFAVAASDGGDSENSGRFNWGNPRSVDDSVALARATGYKHIYILAESMGGIGGVKLIDRLHPVAWAGIYPVCNARSIWQGGESEEAPEIEEAWGPGAPPSSISPVMARDVKGLPVIMFASPEDTDVRIGPNADRCAAWMRKKGATVKIVETVGEHRDPSNFQPQRLAKFFERAPLNR